jgi:hypothetical protein
MLDLVFPGASKWIEMAHKIIGNTELAYLLQRAESYLMLDVVSREFNQKYPNEPIFTIHDAVYLTSEQAVQTMNRMLKNRIKEITGLEVGVKIKSEKIAPENRFDDIEDLWIDIKEVSTKDQYDKISGIFPHNIERGREFLAASIN